MSDPLVPRTYRLLVCMLPRDFRARFGTDMGLLFLDRRAEAGSSLTARAAVWLRGFHDLVRQAAAVRWGSDRRRRATSSPAPGSPEGPSVPTPPRRATAVDHALQDLRYALRGLRGSAGFTTAAIITLALGIGANIAIFTAVNGVLLKPLPYPEPDRLVRVLPELNGNKALLGRVLDAAPAIEEVAGVSGWLFTLTGEGDPLQISGAQVSWNYFEVLGARAGLGRTFSPEEGLVGQADVVVLSHGLWNNVFGGDPDIIGKRIRLAAGEYQTRRVVGVMAEDFIHFNPGFRLWSPLDVDPALTVREDSSWYVNIMIGRLGDGATVERGTEQVKALAAVLREEWPEHFDEEDERLASVVPLQSHMVRDLDDALWTLLSAVGVVLLIACANVANLVLARGTARARDLAMRSALGATRGRLLAQLLAESLLLGAAGCIAGFAVAYAGLRALASAAPERYYMVAEATIDPIVTGFAVAVSLAAVLLFGVVPARRASRTGALEGIAGMARGMGATAGSHRLSKGLVAAEVALSVVLVVGSGLMLRSLWNLYTDDIGFETGGTLSFRISIPEGRFEPEALPAHYDQIWSAIEAVPGVESAGGIHLRPLTQNNWSFPYYAEDNPVPEGTPPDRANHRIVTPSYFRTMAIPLLAGRSFTARDRYGTEPVGMINETMARKLWPDDDPVGKRIRVFGAEFTVVGVVADIRQHGLKYEVQAEMYRPFEQWPTGGMFAMVRTSGDPIALLPSVQRAVWHVDDEAPLARAMAMDEVFGETVADDRFVSLLIAAFGALALVLGAVGVYGVTSYTVGRRLNEFGVRMALGADRTEVLRAAIVDGIRPALVGIGIGLGGAWWASRALASLLYEVGPFDAMTFVAVPVTLATVATAACALPALRASRLDPVTVLRRD